jgi:hypothetical protein
MNEKIGDILQQAISDVDYIHFDDVMDQELSEMFIPDVFAQRFAKLIVDECLAMCDVKTEDPLLSEQGVIFPLLYKTGIIFAVNRCQQNIKQHFGIEE